MEIHGKPTDPYRIFFPLGILFGIGGVSIWPVYYFGITSGFSGRAHAFVQSDGFLYAFVAGFLLTAIPRFTGTEPPSQKSQYALAALLSATAVAFELQLFAIGHVLFAVVHFTVITLAARRFLRREQNPPATFSLVGVGMMCGAIGALLNAAVAWELIDPSWDPLGKRLLTEGMVLSLVLGVGGFLGPRLLGFLEPPKIIDPVGPLERRGRPAFLSARETLMYGTAGLILFFSLIFEYGFGFAGLAFVRAGVATAVVFTTIQPWKLPAVRTTLSWCVWTAHLFLIAGVWLAAIAPRYRIDFLHVLFMGGFTLLILAVGTRVTLSHGGFNLSLERRSWPLRIALTTGLIALLARLGAPFAPFSYFEHLALAALLWIGGISFWGLYLFRLIGKQVAVPKQT